jgi:hypothetical protein
MPPTTQATPPPDPLLQMINDHLLKLTQEITSIRQDVTDLKLTITAFPKELPHKLETIDTRIAVLEQDITLRMDHLVLKTADVAVELSEFQQSTHDRLASILNNPPSSITSIDSIIDTKRAT